jgi:FkbM family methyltransferase
MRLSNNANVQARLFAPLLRYIAKWILHAVRFDSFLTISYSQEGEDLILSRIFGSASAGFYVDVGAYHPKRYSNTYLFYQRGWQGINIDAMPGSMRAFRSARPRDINLEIAIFRVQSKLKYYEFTEPALNGFSRELSEDRQHGGRGTITGELEIEALPLRDVLRKHMPPQQKVIDFMSVDVEGLDLDVLLSNDWTTFRPRVLLVEFLWSSLETLSTVPAHQFLTSVGYRIFAKSFQTVFYLSDEYTRERAASK